MRKSKIPPTPAQLWQADAMAFQRWFRKQKYSMGATPSWTQVAEMERVFCVARKTLREEMRKSEAREIAKAVHIVDLSKKRGR